MKKAVIVGVSCSVILGSMAGCSKIKWVDKETPYKSPDEKKLEATTQSLLDAMEAKDAEGIKKLFSTYAIDNASALDEKIEELIAFYPGCNGGFTELHNEHTTSEYGVIRKVYASACEIVHNGEKYILWIVFQVRNDEEPEQEGIYLIEFVKKDSEPEGFRFQGESSEPGIYLLE